MLRLFFVEHVTVNELMKQKEIKAKINLKFEETRDMPETPILYEGILKLKFSHHDIYKKIMKLESKGQLDDYHCDWYESNVVFGIKYVIPKEILSRHH